MPILVVATPPVCAPACLMLELRNTVFGQASALFRIVGARNVPIYFSNRA
jgi:hypothetical protein